ncbi:MAG: HAD family hydrolase [Candidatus Roizmanbacteria bacterium]|nr:HAD family hydrolase [Candidatus Roizmanbacteria bacterium]
MIKAVLFDIDGVLIDSFEANLRFYQDLFIKTGYERITRERFFELRHMTMYDVITIVTKLENKDEIDRIWKMGKGRAVPYRNSLLKSPEKYDEVIKILHDKYTLGLVTSRIYDGIFTVPQLAKYKSFFKVVVSYEDTKEHKPNPEPLLLALRKLQLKAHEVVYVGDAQSDIDAAKSAHLKVIGYTRSVLTGAGAQTSDFAKIPELIESLP